MAPPFKARTRGSGKGISIELDRAQTGLDPASPLDAVSHGGDALVLVREGQAARGYFAGTLGTFSLPEVFGHIVSSIRTGKLVLETGQFRKTVSFRDGQITFATSTQPHERLGAELVRLGLLTAPEVEDALAQVRPGLRMGQVLTRAGRLSSATLYSALLFLVREIVVDLFEVSEGQFVFLENAGGEDALKLPERTRELMLEGIKRGEEVLRLRKRLPLSLRVARGPGPLPLERAELLTKVERGAPLSVLREAFSGSDYAFFVWVDEQLRLGTLAERPDTGVPPEAGWSVPEFRSTLDLYQEMVDIICRALNEAGKGLEVLRSFFEEPVSGTEEAFAGVTLSNEGKLDVDQVMANTGLRGVARGRAQAYEALEAFISYALFTARNVLSQEQSLELAKKLERIREGGR